MTVELIRQSVFTSFDGSQLLSTNHQRPDRLSHLEAPEKSVYRIPRGGGYSYSAASFGQGTLVQEMTQLNRFLGFDQNDLTITLEAGVRLVDLMEWAIPRQLHFPVLPGYPLVTVGGCIAADVHGKNPYKDGTFSDWVKQLTVFHPEYGYQTCSREHNEALFSLTCGGFGLTGIITDVTLQLAALPSNVLAMTRECVESTEHAMQILNNNESEIAYSWHDATASSSFGKGIVYTGRWAGSNKKHTGKPFSFRPMTAMSRAKLPFSIWNGLTARMANAAVLLQGRIGASAYEVELLNASFPFASNPYFHQFFGKPGLSEAQVLVSNDAIEPFWMTSPN